MIVVELDDIRAFVAIADTGTISGAATELYLSQPAVTRRLQRLESALEATLIDRRRRPFTLTEAGRSILGHCRQLLTITGELRSVASDDDLLTGELRIGVAHALTEVTLIEPIEQLRRLYPKVRLRLRTGWSPKLLERIRRGALDGAILLLPEGRRPTTDVVARKLGRDQLFVVAGSRNSQSSPQSVEGLKDTGWILNPEGCNARVVLQRALSSAGVSLRVDVETYDYDLQLALVARNRGLGLVPGHILERSVLRSRLRILRIPGLEFMFTIWSLRGRLIAGFETVFDELDRKLKGRLAERRRPSRKRSRDPVPRGGAP